MDMTRERWREATRGALQEYLEPKLVGRILDEIDARVKGYQAKQTGRPVYRQAVGLDGAYPNESPARGRDIRAEYLWEGTVRSNLMMGAYIKENTETGICKLYDETGTYIGAVSAQVMRALRENDEITTRHEDEIYDTHWIKEERK